MAGQKTPQFPPLTESEDMTEEREVRIAEMMERARDHRERVEHHTEQANRFTQRAEALKRNPPPNRKRR
jgi:hypothetical protein